MARKSESTNSKAAKATAPMFNHDLGTDSAGVFNSNSHPATDYMTNARLLDPSIPLARQVCEQVFGGGYLGRDNAISFSAATDNPRNPAGWPTTTDRFSSDLKKGNR